jgi:hypothetical protein
VTAKASVRKTDKPDRDTIAAWLTEQGVGDMKAAAWSLFFHGLPWKFIRPLTQITVNAHRSHPQQVMVEAAKRSTDRSFVATTRRHLKAWNQ